MLEEKWIVIYKAAGIINAQIISGRLKSDGIPTRLQYESVGVISFSLSVDGLGEVNICVPESFARQAKEILAQHFNNNDLDWEN